MSESRNLFLVTVRKWRISGQRYKHLTRLSRFLLFGHAASTMQKTNPEGLFFTFISYYLKKIIKIGFPELEKKFLQRFRSFFVK